MNSLVKSLIFPLLESEQKGVALIPGGFKPPTIGHFVLVNEVAQNPNFDKVIVLIGKRETGKSFLVKDLLFYHQDLPKRMPIEAVDQRVFF